MQKTATIPPYRLLTFGGLSVDGRDTDVPAAATQRKRLAFLALLAASEPRGIARERLLLLLWPESTTERARGALYQLLYVVRQAFGESSVVGTDELRLDPNVVSSDVVDFQSALARGDCGAAVDLYRGPYLDAFHVSDAAELERWIDQKRQELARGYQSALSRLVAQAMERKEFVAAVNWATRLVDADPLSDRATVLLMEALAASGDVTAALERARVYAAVVKQELGAEVDPSVSALIARLRRGAPARPAMAADVAAPRKKDSLKPSSAWRTRAVAFAALAVVMIGGGFALLWPRDRPTEFVVVADFTTDSAERGIADYLTDATRRGLSQSRSLGAAPDGRVNSARRRLRIPPSVRLTDSLARQVALGEGIRTVVAGSLTNRGGRFALQLRLISAETGERLASDERTGVPEEKLIPVLDTMTRTLRLRAGDDLNVIRAQPSLLALTSTSLQAMLLYVEARRSPPMQAVPLLRKAIALDSTFAIALWQLTFQMENSDRREERRNLLARAYANRERLTDYERLRVEIAYLYSPDGTTPSRSELVTRLRQIVDKYPNAPDALILANFYLSRREYAAADSAYRRVIALDSNSAAAYVSLVSVHLATDQRRAARTTVDALVRRFGPHPWEAFVSYAEGRRDKARASLEATLRTPSMLGPAMDHRSLALIDLLEGRLADWARNWSVADSIDVAQNRGAQDFSRPELWANYWVRQSRGDESVRILNAVANSPRVRHLELAEFYAQFGRAKEARAHLLAYDSLVKDTFMGGSGKHSVMGWIDLAENNPREAIVEFLASQTLPDGAVKASDIEVDPQIGLAYERAGVPDSAIIVYEHYLKRSTVRMEDAAYKLEWVLERVAPLYARRGDREKAKAAYARIVDVWKNADPELQPRVKNAQARIVALSR